MPGGASSRRPRAMVSALGPDSSIIGSWPLAKEETSLGASGEIRVPDPFATAIQGHFAFKPTGLSFYPERTPNGTFLLLRREHPLSPGTEFRVGRQLMRLATQPPRAVSAEPVWGSPNPGFKFRVVQLLAGGLEGDSFPLRDGDNLIGRAAGDLSFPGDGYVSSRHAMLVVKGDQAILRDLGSSNGTFVRMESETAITPGDLLLVGEQLLRIDAA